MPKVRLLVSTADAEGNSYAPNQEADVSDELANEWRLAGKAQLVEDEQRSAAAAEQGHYTDVTGREDVAPLAPGSPQPGPQAEDKGDDDEDQPRGKKGKK